MTKKVLIVLFILTGIVMNAQQDNQPQMADALRQNGKINVVIAVIGIIFAALAIFMVYLERRISRLEKKTDNKF